MSIDIEWRASISRPTPENDPAEIKLKKHSNSNPPLQHMGEFRNIEN